MKRFIEGESRNQITLMPACLDDYIDTDNLRISRNVTGDFAEA